MLKISDILKKARGQGRQKNKKKAEKTKQNETPKPISETPQSKEKKRDIPPVDLEIKSSKNEEEIEPVVNSKVALGEIASLYQQAVALVKEILSPLAKKKNLISKAEELVDKFVDIIKKDSTTLLKFFFCDYEVLNEYMYQHAVNVCIFSLALGIGMRYDNAHLKKLGVGALLHDAGLGKFDSIINKPRKLEPGELEEVKRHPAEGKEVLKKYAKYLDFKIFDIVYQEHERINGSGYPQGLKNDMIDEDAKLIGLVDVYEAIIHSRPHRPKFSCQDAIQLILNEKKAFEYKFIKNLIDTIGIYPIGTLVELNTREVGVVLKQTPKMPFRPSIDITHNSNRQKMTESKHVDLSSNFSIYIKHCFSEFQKQ
ncbi:MAG: HD domain-containing protein [PVC group bacterium]|nr:HD domain-containing protein [PVC group bacterium]